MDFILGCIFLAGAFAGFLSALKEMREFKEGKIKGIKSSKGLFDFLFSNN